MIKRRLWISLTLSLLVLSSARAQDADSEQDYVRLGDILSIEAPIASEDTMQFIARAYTDVADSGARRHLESKRLAFVQLRKVALEALKKNLSIRVSEQDSLALAQAIYEAEAVFDPVFAVSIGRSQSQTQNRSRFGTVNLQAFQPFPGVVAAARPLVDPRDLIPFPGVLSIPTSPFVTTPQVDLLAFIQEQGGEQSRKVFASKKKSNSPEKTWNYDVSVEQQLPWGPSYTIGLFTTDKDVFRDKFGRSFDRDYATELVFDLLLPLPYTRDFGRNAPADVDLRLSRKISERSEWDLKAIINDILRDTDIQYWELVRLIEDLGLVLENRKLVEQQVETAKRLFDQGYSTAYGKAQIESELARLQVLEESTKVDIITTANRLGTLVEQDGIAAGDTLYLPRDYRPLMENLLVVNPTEAVAQGLQFRPELRAEQIQREAALIQTKFARAQLRPDINVNVAVSSAQDSKEFGYGEYLDSLDALDDPDRLSETYGISYRYPLRNRALKAGYTQALKQDEDQTVVVRSLENNIARDINDALADLLGARARIEIAEKNVAYSQSAYDKLVNRRRLGGDVRELEVIAKSQELLEAKRTRLFALVDNKIAETRLLAAQGTIAAEYPELTARTDFERQRLGLLQRLVSLSFFGSQPAAP